MNKNSNSDSFKTKKCRRTDEIEAENSGSDRTVSLEENLTFSETLVALRIMRAQFPHIDKVSIQPFILQSQLYSSVSDRTQVNRELESLRRERALHVFKLNTGQDDHAIMFLDDCLNQCSLLLLGGKVKDEHISLLINAGLLGRKELLSFLNCRKYKEMMLATLEKKHLRFSPLDIIFHLRDLIGSGILKTIHKPTGLVVRVSKA